MRFWGTVNDGASAFSIDADTREQAEATVSIELGEAGDVAGLKRLLVLSDAEWNDIGGRAQDASEFRQLLEARRAP